MILTLVRLLGKFIWQAWALRIIIHFTGFPVLGLDPERVGNDQDGDGFTIGAGTTMFIGNGPSICIAYVSSPAYTALAERMKYILETYFTCNVQLYTGDYDRWDSLVVLVLSSLF